MMELIIKYRWRYLSHCNSPYLHCECSTNSPSIIIFHPQHITVFFHGERRVWQKYRPVVTAPPPSLLSLFLPPPLASHSSLAPLLFLTFLHNHYSPYYYYYCNTPPLHPLMPHSSITLIHPLHPFSHYHHYCHIPPLPPLVSHSPTTPITPLHPLIHPSLPHNGLWLAYGVSLILHDALKPLYIEEEREELVCDLSYVQW